MSTIVNPNTRQRRLLEALARGPVTRQDADRIAPASNSPHFVGILRRCYLLTLPCVRVPCFPVDGGPSWFGQYTPTAADRRKIGLILDATATGDAV